MPLGLSRASIEQAQPSPAGCTASSRHLHRSPAVRWTTEQETPSSGIDWMQHGVGQLGSHLGSHLGSRLQLQRHAVAWHRLSSAPSLTPAHSRSAATWAPASHQGGAWTSTRAPAIPAAAVSRCVLAPGCGLPPPFETCGHPFPSSLLHLPATAPDTSRSVGCTAAQGQRSRSSVRCHGPSCLRQAGEHGLSSHWTWRPPDAHVTHAAITAIAPRTAVAASAAQRQLPARPAGRSQQPRPHKDPALLR